MAQGRLSDTGHIFKEQVAPRQEADHRHFNHMGFSLDDQRDIVLDGPDRVNGTHGGVNGPGGLGIMGNDRHERSLAKGLKTVNFHACFDRSLDDFFRRSIPGRE